MTRDEIVIEARSWIDTGWHHRACEKGVGVDCVRLIEAIGRVTGAIGDDFVMPDYDPNPDGVTLMRLCGRHLTSIDTSKRDIGDVVVIKSDDSRWPHHVGILAPYRHGGFSIIHACNAPSCTPPRVIETRLMFSRTTRLIAAFSFPGVS
jgi:hypothetical protein